MEDKVFVVEVHHSKDLALTAYEVTDNEGQTVKNLHMKLNNYIRE